MGEYISRFPIESHSIWHIDHKSLRYLLEQWIATQNQQNWLAKLLGYEFEIVYRVGAINMVVDALSLKFEDASEEELELGVLFKPFWLEVQLIDTEVP